MEITLTEREYLELQHIFDISISNLVTEIAESKFMNERIVLIQAKGILEKRLEAHNKNYNEKETSIMEDMADLKNLLNKAEELK